VCGFPLFTVRITVSIGEFFFFLDVGHCRRFTVKGSLVLPRWENPAVKVKIVLLQSTVDRRGDDADEMYHSLRVRLFTVKSHQGNEWNEPSSTRLDYTPIQQKLEQKKNLRSRTPL
jgi:hypothetical protein